MKIEHGSVTHDDSLFAYLVGHYVWTYGTNLSSFYIHKKRKFGASDYTEYDEYDVEDIDEAEQRFIQQFNSVAFYNKSTHNYSNSISAQEMIDDYMLQQQRNYYKEQEDKQIRENDMLKTLNSFYNNGF